jgi:hypothetical protein
MRLPRLMLAMVALTLLAQVRLGRGGAQVAPKRAKAQKTVALNLANEPNAMRLLQSSPYPLKDGKEDCAMLAQRRASRSLGELVCRRNSEANVKQEVKCTPASDDFDKWTCKAVFASKRGDPQFEDPIEATWVFRYDIEDGDIPSLVCFFAGRAIIPVSMVRS